MPRPRSTRQPQRRSPDSDEHGRYQDLGLACLFAHGLMTPEEREELPRLEREHCPTCATCHDTDRCSYIHIHRDEDCAFRK